MKALAAALAVSFAVAATGVFAAGGMDFVLGKALFERDWLPAPASTDAADGLGPLFGARSCAGCHAGPGLGARFTAISDGKVAGRGLVLRFGDADGRPDPVYGHLLQNQAMPGMQAEGRLVLTAAAGADLAYDVAVHLERGAVDPATRFSFRAAPPLAGRAALEAIDAKTVMALADPDDRDGDGISGRARMVEEDGRSVLGRYGWKAAIPDLELQVADAFARDLGLSSPRRALPHGDCTAREPDCLAGLSGASARLDGHELSAEMVGLVVAYVRGLPGPAREDVGPGRETFAALGCGACHVPALAAGGGTVAAYTDLLLHDMGPGLDDRVGEPGVASAEWRTAPLMTLAGQDKGRRYLHDGRAATLDAAIRLHGGEAAQARSRYEALPDEDKRALVAFLEGL